MSYPGRERRIHHVFVTRNTEYHIRRRLCVGVRDRRTGQWISGHLALESEMAGALRFNRHGGLMPNEGKPEIGESLFFYSAGRDLVTSPVVSVERPSKETVRSYESASA